jgi:hypothetical protein
VTYIIASKLEWVTFHIHGINIGQRWAQECRKKALQQKIARIPFKILVKLVLCNWLIYIPSNDRCTTEQTGKFKGIPFLSDEPQRNVWKQTVLLRLWVFWDVMYIVQQVGTNISEESTYSILRIIYLKSGRKKMGHGVQSVLFYLLLSTQRPSQNGCI